MQIPILSGIYTDENSDFRTSYPVNMIPVPKSTGINQGYLQPAEGIIQFCATDGIDRGGINWNGVLYRVIGSKLVRVSDSGNIVIIGDVGISGTVTFDYSFDYLAVSSNGKFFLYDGVTLAQVTDPDLGIVNSFVWIDGYFLTTDGGYIVCTDINDPFSVNPLNYGSSEADPDPIKQLLRLRSEVYALNRYTIEVFENVGGSGFPFRRIQGAQMQRGTLGARTACVYAESIAFLGSGRNESPAIWIGSNADTTKISTREIDIIIGKYNELELSSVILEAMAINGHQFLYVHLKDQTLVYDVATSQALSTPVWFILSSASVGTDIYKCRNMIFCYDKWICGDPTANRLGYLTETVSNHYGDSVRWEFGTQIIYNEGRGAIFHDVELVGLPGRVNLTDTPTIWMTYSLDGQIWSQERPIICGLQGQRDKRIKWFRCGTMRNYRMQKFYGNSDARLSIARLEITLEPLNA